MGMFDTIEIDAVHGVPDDEYQTKDTPAQYLDHYRIDAEGRLWHQEYDFEDRSDPNAEGLRRAAGCMTRVNKRWVPVSDFRGAIHFYGDGEYSALFDDGMMLNLKRLDTPTPEARDE